MPHKAIPILPARATSALLGLLADPDLTRPLAWRDGVPISVAAFLADVQRTAHTLPARTAMLNLCADRYAFLVAFCAALCRGQYSLLPPSRAKAVIDELLHDHSGSYAAGDRPMAELPIGYVQLPHCSADGHVDTTPRIPADALAAIGFTSGSTGRPQAQQKRWQSLWHAGSHNAAVLAKAAALAPGQCAHVVATVAAQHMYGMELSVMLPLLGPFAVHSGHPLLAADIAATLAQLPEPRVLVTTPVHLRALLHAGVRQPALAAVVSATAPLSRALAQESEQFLQAPLVELFGSTETCVIAHRQPARESRWTLYDGVDLQPQPDGTAIHAAHLPAGLVLQDVVEMEGSRHFYLRGRNADMIDIAGKRASLNDLTQRLLSVPGVVDAVVVQCAARGPGSVQRIAALAVAPGLDRSQITAQLRQLVDPVFLPRPLRLVDALPRNANGKMPRAQLMAMLREN